MSTKKAAHYLSLADERVRVALEQENAFWQTDHNKIYYIKVRCLQATYAREVKRCTK